eukprot:scaffold29240_cov55-Phaeocystis_antarctica.AAC.1
MRFMFDVRSSPCPAPNLQSSPALHAACTAVARRLFRLPTQGVGVQPAAELRHLQPHRHGRHVLGALVPVPCPQSAIEPCPARCLHRGRPPPLPPAD